MAARHKRKLRQVLGQLLDEAVRPSSQVGFCHLHVQFVDNLRRSFPSASPYSLPQFAISCWWKLLLENLRKFTVYSSLLVFSLAWVVISDRP